MTKSEVVKLQREINAEGYGPVRVDGVYGPKTADAYETMARDSSLMGEGNEAAVPAPDKPWWTSPSLLGGIGMMLTGLLNLFGVDLDAELVQSFIISAVGTIAGVMAIYGALTRRGRVDSDLVVPGVRISRMRRRAMPSDVDASDADNSNFPDGPFFDE